MKPTQSESVRPDPNNPNAAPPTPAARPDLLRPEPNGARISRRTALRQLAVGGTGLALGLQRAYAPPVQNNLLGSVIEYPQGNWWTQCLDYSGTSCTNPIWKNIINDNPAWGYVNNNHAGNSSPFSASGGYSWMWTNDISFVARKIYKISWVGEIVSSTSSLDELRFLINGVIVDKMHREDLKSQRSVLFVGDGQQTELRWHFEKNVGTNTSIRFRADNLQVEQLPEPVLATFQQDANHIVVWWDKIYGRDTNGSYLLESPSLQNPDWQVNIDPNWTQTDSIGATIGYGKIIDLNYANTRHFKLRVEGTPAAP